MDSMLSSTFSGALSLRESSTAVDPSSLIASSAAEATTDRGGSSMNQFSPAEMEFEARNWRAARDVFQNKRGHKDKKAMANFLTQQESPQQAKASCIEASNRASKQYAPGVGGVLKKMEAFMNVGDVAMKTAPESVGLAWMGIRLCMHSVEDDFGTFNLFCGAASDIIGILISCRFYGKMYGGDKGQKGLQDFQELHQKVVDYIPGIYTEILEFSYQMSKQMGRNMGSRLLRGLLSSAVNKFKPMIDGIKASEKTMSEFAKKATDQLSIHYAELGLQKQDTGLENQQVMMANLAVIQDTLNSNFEIRKIFADQIKQLEEERKNLKKKTPLDKAKEKFEENEKKLRPTDSSELAFERSKSRKEEGTCEWIFELEEYKSWRTSSENGIIWVSGVGGMGKSILLSNVIDRLQNEMKDSADCSLQYVICSAGDDATRLVPRIKDQLLHQLYKLSLSQESLEKLEKANEFVVKFLEPSEGKGGSQQKKSVATSFEDVYPSLATLLDKNIYLIIDALDECTERKESRFLKTLQDMLSLPDSPGFRFHIIICSRPEPDVEDDLTGKPVIKVADHNAPDIERAAKFKLNSLPGLSPTERTLACEAIVAKAKGLFRCVDPAIDFLKKPLQRPLEKALERLPDGLDNSYQQILRQTDPEYLELLKTALHWSILGERKPTIAEIMDDYSRAYAQNEGSDVNPYDELEDPTVPDEAKRLIQDQIRKAGSSTFLEVSGNIVTTRHTTVTDFFKRTTPSTDQPGDHCEDKLCPSCKIRAINDQSWTLTDKEGHLRMAITIFRHLNSPLFRKRYLPEDPAAGNSAEVIPKKDDTDGPATHGSNESPLAANTTDGAQEAATLRTEASTKMSGSAKFEPLDQQDKVPLSDIDGVLEEESTKNNGGDAKNSDIDGVLEEESTNNNGGDAKNSDEPAKPATDGDELEPAAAQQEPLTDDEDEYKDEDNSDSSSNAGVPADGVEVIKPVRYELTYWPNHLQEVEKLWTRDERFTNSDWKELWAHVLKFLCDSPRAFMTWQRHYMGLKEYFFDDGLDVDLNPLQVAAAYGLTGLCEKLIERGQSAKAELADGRSTLWFAAEHSIELLRLLLVHGASPNSEKGVMNPFQKLLCLNPNLEGVKLMLEFKGDCKAKDDFGYTVIHWFSLSGCDVEILRLLLANGGEINAIDKYGETGLHKLLWQDPVPLPLLHEFIKSGADVNLSDKESQQPLYEVCSQGSVEGTRILLDHVADIDHADIYGVTALHAAARAGHLEPVKLLVERQASLIKSDTRLRTAFFSACAENQLETARFLLAAAHDQGHHDSIRQAMDDGRTPFSKACGRGHLGIVKMLLAHPDANIDVNAVEGAPKRTALHWAAYNARVEVVLFLLQNGADVTIKDANGKTALNLGGLSWSKNKSLSREPMILALIERDEHTAAQDTDLMAIAAIRNSAKVIEKLLDAKAHPSKQDEHGWTPLQLAKQYGSTDAATILAKRGAVVGAQPSKWVTESEKIRLSEDGGELEFIGEAASGVDHHTILANHPIPAGIERFYFEVEIKPDRGRDKYLFNAIGFATNPARLEAMPGWHNPIAPSWAFHGDDGRIYANSNDSLRDYAEPYGKGATIGCGIIYQNSIDGHVFYTRDGEPLGVAFDKSVRGRLYPAVGMSEPAVIAANWGDDKDGRPFLWAPANMGSFDLEAVRAKNAVEEPVTKVVPTKIEFGPAVTLVNA